VGGRRIRNGGLFQRQDRVNVPVLTIDVGLWENAG
jgi:hypothetical protein